MKFTFSWNPDRSDAIRAVGAGAATLKDWASAVPAPGVDVDPSDIPALINLSDFADDMDAFLEDLRRGLRENTPPDGGAPADESGHPDTPVLDAVSERLGLRVGASS